MIFFKIAQKSTITYLGYCCKQICCLELSKIAQSGHTAITVESKLCFQTSPWLFTSGRQAGREGAFDTVTCSREGQSWRLLRFIKNHLNWRKDGSKMLWSVWPDLAKFRHFGQNFKNIWPFFECLFRNYQSFKPTLEHFNAFRQDCIAVNWLILNK